MDDYEDDYYQDDEIESCQVEDSNGVVHYFEDGVEVETFVPEWG